jgi:uncharacterized protein (TIGR03663 family)
MQNEEKDLTRSKSESGSDSSFFILHSSLARRWSVFIVLALLALAVRLPQLGARPMHTDESINAYIVGDILAGNGYRYDPQDRHGPVLYAVAAPVARLLGARSLADLSEWELRLTPVLIGSATILLIGASVEMFGFIPCLVAALLFAFGPLPVYYNRYFIHETLFVAATLGLILTGWNAWQKSSWWSAVLAGLCAALMVACKETAVIHLAAIAITVLCGWLLPPRETFPAPKLIAVAIAVLAFFSVLLFTWFGHNWTVFADLWHAVSRFAARAGGEGHEKPFSYYFHLLDPMFVLFLVAIAGAYAAICDAVAGVRKPHLLMVVYGAAVFLIYSLIPYKTPWLALNMWLPLSLVCGFGAAAFLEYVRHATGRWVAAVAGIFLLGALGMQTKLLAFDQPADEKNPFAYAHTTDDILGLPPRLEELSKLNHLTQPRIAVVAADAWPLPWYLRKFSNVGYWQPGQDTGAADFFITTADMSESLKAQLKDYRPEFFGVRPGVLILLWIPPPMKKTG